MISWISNSHKHPKSFTLTDDEILEWKNYQKDHTECYGNNVVCSDDCDVIRTELNEKYIEMNRV